MAKITEQDWNKFEDTFHNGYNDGAWMGPKSEKEAWLASFMKTSKLSRKKVLYILRNYRNFHGHRYSIETEW